MSVNEAPRVLPIERVEIRFEYNQVDVLTRFDCDGFDPRVERVGLAD